MQSNDLVGNKKCNTKELIGNSSLPACYVVLPSNCSFIANSTKYVGLQISSDPCQGKKYFTDLGLKSLRRINEILFFYAATVLH